MLRRVFSEGILEEVMEQYTPMIRQYLEIKADYPDAFLFFRLGDFYELFFDDAVLASRELEITLTGRDGGTKERIPMCGVPHHSAEGYIKTLIQKGYKVAICEQIEDPKEAKGVVKREVTRVITPGTVMDSSMLSAENNFLCVIVKHGESFGLAVCDLTTGEFYLPEVALHSLLAVLEEVLTFTPKELILSGDLTEAELNLLRSHIQAAFSSQKRDKDEAELADIVKVRFPDQYGRIDPLCVQAAGLLLQYLHQTQKRGIDHIRELQIYQPNRHMILDPFTRRNLEITETIRNKSKYGSLLWLMDQCVTPMGSRMLKRWMDKPLVNRELIEERLDAVQFFIREPLIRAELRSLLKEVYDLERLAGRIAYGNVNGRDMVQIRRTLQVIPNILSCFKPYLETLPQQVSTFAHLDPCLDIYELLDRAIVDDPPVTVKEGGIIKAGYHAELDRLREASRDGKQWIAALEQQERELTGIRSLKVGYNKVFGYYIEVTKANLSLLPEGRYERKQTLANAERFVTAELKEKEALILEAEERMVDLEYELFLQVRERLISQIPRFQMLAKQVASLDCLLSLAELAVNNRYVRPTFHLTGEMHIEGGRHPVIEAVLQNGKYIPNPTHLDQEHSIYLITGPNMAGKSTYMRQVALIQIMFQMGSFVPADRAELPIVDRIFTRIGAADDLVEGQSTFMVEMKEIQVTTTQATRNSLVIIDELGRGTSTQDGIAIAQAVIEHLHDRIGCKTLVSTHFHELAALEEFLPRLRNYHMAVKETKQDVIFTRQLVAGAASKSYGIYCAKLAGLPETIIERANQLIADMGQGEGKQLDLFSQAWFQEEAAPDNMHEAEVINRIKSLDVNNLTPIQALNLISEWKTLISAPAHGER
jgi:DNA mismatch repair protein MutS